MAVYEWAVRIDFQGSGSPGYNIWHSEDEDMTGAEPDIDTQAENLVAFYDAIKGLYPTGTTITVPRDVVRVDTDPPEDVEFDSVEVLGGQSGVQLSELLCIVVSWGTGVRSRSGRGRTFIGPLNQNCADPDGTPNNGAAGAIQVAATTLILEGFPPNATGGFGVYSRKLSEFRRFQTATVRQDQFSYLSSRRD